MDKGPTRREMLAAILALPLCGALVRCTAQTRKEPKP